MSKAHGSTEFVKAIAALAGIGVMFVIVLHGVTRAIS